MSQAAKIDSKFATAEETAHILGVPLVRAQQLMDMAETGNGPLGRSRRASSRTKFSRKAHSASFEFRRKAASTKRSSKSLHASRKKAARAKASKTAR
jgi:hypothetical protein